MTQGCWVATTEASSVRGDAVCPYQSGGLRGPQGNLDQFTQAPRVSLSSEQENGLPHVPSSILSSSLPAASAWPSESTVSTITFVVTAKTPQEPGPGPWQPEGTESRGQCRGGVGSFPGGPEQPLPGRSVCAHLVGESQVNVCAF